MDTYGVAGSAIAEPDYSTGKLQRVTEQTELTSLLSTCTDQARDIRRLVAVILDRVSPQSEADGSDKQDFRGGYVGMAEELRSTQRETLDALTLLAKLA